MSIENRERNRKVVGGEPKMFTPDGPVAERFKGENIRGLGRLDVDRTLDTSMRAFTDIGGPKRKGWNWNNPNREFKLKHALLSISAGLSIYAGVMTIISSAALGITLIGIGTILFGLTLAFVAVRDMYK